MGGKCSLHLHRLPGTVRFETNCRMRSIFMDSINRKRRKTYPRKNNHQIFPFWIICFELTIIGNSKQIIKKEKMEHNILKSLQPLFNQGLESYDVHNYSLIHMPIPSSFSLLKCSQKSENYDGWDYSREGLLRKNTISQFPRNLLEEMCYFKSPLE